MRPFAPVLEGDRPPARARLVCYLLLGLLALCAVARVEWWPFSSFELFSRERTGVVRGWEIALVDDAATEHPLPVGWLPRSFRGAHHILSTLGHRPAAERDEICRSYAEAGAAVLGLRATAVRVYRVIEAPGAPRRRTLDLTCAGLP